MTLLTEIENGPLAAEIAPHSAIGSDQAIADILNRRDIPVPGTITTNDFVVWAASSGQRAVIEDTAADTQDPLRSIALALQDLVRGNLQQGLDFARPETVAMADAWLTAGKMDQTDYDALMTASQKLISRAEQVGLHVDSQAVAAALRG